MIPLKLLTLWLITSASVASTTVLSLTESPYSIQEADHGFIDSTKMYPFDFEWKSINTAKAEIALYSAGVREIEFWARARQINDGSLGNIGPSNSSPWVLVDSIITKTLVTTHTILLDPVIDSPIEVCVGFPQHDICLDSAVIFPTHALVGVGANSEIRVMNERHRDLLTCTTHSNTQKRCQDTEAAQRKAALLSDGRMTLRSHPSTEPTAVASLYCILPLDACRPLKPSKSVQRTWILPFHRLTELPSPVFEATPNDAYEVNELIVKHNNSARRETLQGLPGQLLITSTAQSPKVIFEMLQAPTSDTLIGQSKRLVNLVLLWEALQLDHEPFLSWRIEQQRLLDQLLLSQGKEGLWSANTAENIAVLDALLLAHEQGFISSSQVLLSAISALCETAPEQLHAVLGSREGSDWEGLACLDEPKTQSPPSDEVQHSTMPISKQLAAVISIEGYTHISFNTKADGTALTGRVHTWQREHIQHPLSSTQELVLSSHGTGTLYWALLRPKNPILGSTIPTITGTISSQQSACAEAKLGDRITLTAEFDIALRTTKIGWQHSAGLSHSQLGPIRWIELTDAQKQQSTLRITEHTLAAHKGTFRVPSPLVNHAAITHKEQCITIR